MPKYLSSDHDPLDRFGQWQANLRILEMTEIKTVPYVPLSHPFVERLIGTIRREYWDRTLFWTTADLEDKLLDFRTYFNEHRSHTGLQGRMPDQATPCRDLSPVSIPMAGNAIAEASITHPRPPDSPKNSAPGGIRRKSANRTSTGTICCFVLLSAPRLADLILSLSTECVPQL